jgi:nicotinamidase-related amidase
MLRWFAVAVLLVLMAPVHAAESAELVVPTRRQEARPDADGHLQWQVITADQRLKPAETAIIICDMWDKHWSRGATERVGTMAPRMNTVLVAARRAGVTIIHAPSETMEFYKDTPARLRVQRAPRVEPPAEKKHDDPPQPVDDSDGGSDTGEKPWYKAWQRQHPAIEIDQEKDGISDDGREIWNCLQQKGIRNVLIMGVHTNMCVLGRSFAIKQMVRWGMNVMLVRDLTDAMYNPARPPYVSHAEGTRLIVEFIEKFWCPTITGEDLLKSVAAR